MELGTAPACLYWLSISKPNTWLELITYDKLGIGYDMDVCLDRVAELADRIRGG